MSTTSAATKVALDEYSRNARLKPAFLVVLPVGLLVSVFGLKASVMLAAVSGPLATLGLTLLLAQIGRDFGKRKEPLLYLLWGGKPSVAKMRHRDPSMNKHTRARYHQKAEIVLGFSLPDVTSEENDPNAADAVYEAYSNLLLERTRDRKKFPLIFQELVNYGFRRNLWGMRPIGLTLSATCVVLEIGGVAYSALSHQMPSALALTSVLLSIFLLACWIFLINPEWVRLVANAYAERLLASSEMLQTATPPSSVEKEPSRRRRTKTIS